MKKIIFLYSIALLSFISCKQAAQVEPGVYYTENKTMDALGAIRMDYLYEDGKSKFVDFYSDSLCQHVEINSTWEYNNGILSFTNQKEKEREECDENFSLEKSIDDDSYTITEFGDGYFIGQSIQFPDIIIKWIKKK